MPHFDPMGHIRIVFQDPVILSTLRIGTVGAETLCSALKSSNLQAEPLRSLKEMGRDS